MAVKRTRPAGRADRPDRTVDIPHGPHPGCCVPYPYAVFRNERLVQLDARHVGRFCKGSVEPMDMEAFHAEVNRRASSRSPIGGDD